MLVQVIGLANFQSIELMQYILLLIHENDITLGNIYSNQNPPTFLTFASMLQNKTLPAAAVVGSFCVVTVMITQARILSAFINI